MRVALTCVPSSEGSRVKREFGCECVEFFAEVVQLFGVQKSVGQIFGVLYASPVPLSFSDIVDRLKISKGSASQGLQLLRSLGAISIAERKLNSKNEIRDAPSGKQMYRQTPNHGSSLLASCRGRRDYYEPELSLRKLLSGVLRERLAPLATTSSCRLVRLRELAGQVTTGEKFYLDRAKQLDTWRRRLKAILPVLSALLGSPSKK